MHFKNQPHSSEIQLCISKDALGGLLILYLLQSAPCSCTLLKLVAYPDIDPE